MEIIGYKWKLYYDSTLLREDDEVFDTPEEAKKEASIAMQNRIEQWKLDGGWNKEYDNEANFEIYIIAVTEEGEF